MADAVRRILAVTDLGDDGARAIAAAGELAQATGAALTIVHATPHVALVRPVFPQHVALDAVHQAELPDQARHVLEDQVTEALPDLDVELHVEEGHAAEVALDTAARCDAGLIVVAASDRDTIDTERIVRHALVPVLIVRPGPETGPVIACTDFSDPAMPAIRTARDEARRTSDPLLVVHAIEPIPYAGHGIEALAAIPNAELRGVRLADAEKRLSDAVAANAPEATSLVVEGPASTCLIATAAERGARLIVVGTVGRTGLTRFLLGSVAEAIVRHAPCSVLVVRLHKA